MEQRQLGSAPFQVSVFGLGTMTFGAESDERTSHAILDAYRSAGGALVDTANVYSTGVSEEIIGSWLAGRSDRDEMIIATKARFAMSEDPADSGAGEEHLTEALDASLRRLGVDVVDLYQVHAWDHTVPVVETLETLNAFVDAGKVRSIGVSNYLGWQLERAIMTARHEGLSPIVSLQPQYSLMGRDIELEIVPLCLDEGIGLLPWSPLGGGWLTGKYERDTTPSGVTRLGDDPARGIEAFHLRNNERTFSIIDAVRGVAADRGVTMSQVALNWVRNRPGVSSVLLGCRNLDQLLDNLAALDWDLSGEEMTVLDDVSAPGIPLYPHGFLEVETNMTVWAEMRTRTEPPY